MVHIAWTAFLRRSSETTPPGQPRTPRESSGVVNHLQPFATLIVDKIGRQCIYFHHRSDPTEPLPVPQSVRPPGRSHHRRARDPERQHAPPGAEMSASDLSPVPRRASRWRWPHHPPAARSRLVENPLPDSGRRLILSRFARHPSPCSRAPGRMPCAPTAGRRHARCPVIRPVQFYVAVSTSGGSLAGLMTGAHRASPPPIVIGSHGMRPGSPTDSCRLGRLGTIKPDPTASTPLSRH